MTYDEAVAFYHSLMRFGINPGLERIHALCEKLGSPQKNLKFVHVAGTNGKGTVCTEIASVLGASGYSAGLYTSPYVIDFRERIQLGGKLISKDELIDVTQHVKAAVEKLNAEGIFPTEFEAVTAAAFLYYKMHNCDIVVLEVGLGGRFDATNIISAPLCSIIVSISLDHVNVLGGTLGEIAREKCGIIKSGSTVFTSVNQPTEALGVIKNTCLSAGCPLEISDENKNFTVIGSSLFGTRVLYNGSEMQIPFSGKHQTENASLAVSACEMLRSNGFEKITHQSIIKGIENSFIPARTEVLCKNPLIILDGSHNEGSTLALKNVLNKNLKNKKILAVMGMMRDKDCTAALDNLLPCFSSVIAVTPSNPRAMPADEFCKIVSERGVPCTVHFNPCDGIDAAFAALPYYDALCVCGSLYLSADVRRYILRKCGKSAY